jgi:hypothetical protein
MTITYAITVCNEFVEIQRLIGFLLKNKRIHDKIVVLYDSKNGDREIEAFLRSHSINGEFAWHKAEFQGHFADWKNRLSSLCTTDYIFQIDADEIPHEKLIELLPEILQENIECDIIMVPRVNTVEGLTHEHVAKWGWNVNEKGWVNWPDEQWRIYKNKSEIKWVNKVHERLEGHKIWTHLPIIEEFALYHPKTIERQVKQNELYSKLG